MGHSNAPSLAELINRLLERRSLNAAEMSSFLERLLSPEEDELQKSAALIAFRAKGETGPELAAAANFLRKRMICIAMDRPGLLDTCGTGGDGFSTFNISTATAFVAAAAGVPVVKHGNRAISGRTGSMDVLGVLGVPAASNPESARQCVEAHGLAFCSAPLFHPALKSVAELRRRLGVRTLFNFLGPLLNPAGAGHQLIGVGHRDWLVPLAEALSHLGAEHAFVVSGEDGLDEVTLTGVTRAAEVRGNRPIQYHEWQPEDFGLPRCRLEDLVVADAQESALRIQAVLEGQPGPSLDIVLANAAAALVAAHQADTLQQGVERARHALAQGTARDRLERLKRFSLASASPAGPS